MLSLRGLVASLDGQQIVEFESEISLQESASVEQDVVLANELGITVANGLIERGAGVILAELAHWAIGYKVDFCLDFFKLVIFPPSQLLSCISLDPNIHIIPATLPSLFI